MGDIDLHSLSSRRSRRSRGSQVKVNEAVNSWIEENIKKRECVQFIARKRGSDKCGCGRTKSQHFIQNPVSETETVGPAGERWDVHRHTTTLPTDAYGVVEFQGGPHPTRAKYVRLDYESSPESLMKLLWKGWRLSPPSLVISVLGGLANFQLQPKLKRVFNQGLLKAAQTTGAWVVTTGLDTGVTWHVREALEEQIHCRNNRIVSLGIAPWGVLQQRDQMVGHDRVCPSYFTGSLRQRASLNEGHNFFMLADNGTVGKYGAEVTLRRRLTQRLANHTIDMRKWGGTVYRTPIVGLLIEGGSQAFRQVFELLTGPHPAPVVVCDGTGRAADLLAFVHRYSTDDEDLPTPLKEQILDVIRRTYQVNNTQASELYKEIRLCMRRKDLITVFRMEEGNQLDLAILTALLKMRTSTPSEQLSLTMAWRRPDIAKAHVLSAAYNPEGGTSLDQGMLEVHMMDALLGSHVPFVELLLEYGISMQHFLTTYRLERLYAVPEGFLPLIFPKLSAISMETFPLSLRNVGKAIQEILRKGYQHPYCQRMDKNFQRENSQSFLIKGLGSTLYPGAGISVPAFSESSATFRYPYTDLMQWALLCRRFEVAKFMALAGEEALAKALFAVNLLHGLRNFFDADTEDEIMKELAKWIDYFESEAIKMLDHCYKHNPQMTQKLLTYELSQFSCHNCLSLAFVGHCRPFLSHSGVQHVLNDLWYGGLVQTPFLGFKVLVCVLVIYCPFWILLILVQLGYPLWLVVVFILLAYLPCFWVMLPFLFWEKSHFFTFKTRGELALQPCTLEEHLHRSSSSSSSSTSSTSSNSPSSSDVEGEAHSSHLFSESERGQMLSPEVTSLNSGGASRRRSGSIVKRKRRRKKEEVREVTDEGLSMLFSENERGNILSSDVPSVVRRTGSIMKRKRKRRKRRCSSNDGERAPSANAAMLQLTQPMARLAFAHRQPRSSAGCASGLLLDDAALNARRNTAVSFPAMERRLTTCSTMPMIPGLGLNGSSLAPNGPGPSTAHRGSIFLGAPGQTDPLRSVRSFTFSNIQNPGAANYQYMVKRKGPHSQSDTDQSEELFNFELQSKPLNYRRRLYEFFSSPIYRYFSHLIAFFLFVTVLFVACLMRPNESRLDLHEYYLAAYVMTYFFELIRMWLESAGSTTWEKTRVYFSDVNTVCELFLILYCFVVIGFRIASLYDSSLISWVYHLMGLGCGAWILHTYHVIVLFRDVGMWLYLITRLITNSGPVLLVLLFIPMTAFGLVRQNFMKANQTSLSVYDVAEVFIKPYFMLYGEVYADEIDPRGWQGVDRHPLDFLVPVLMFVYLLFTIIMMLSVLVARFSDLYGSMKEQSSLIYHFLRYNCIMTNEARPLLPPPLSVFVYIYYGVRWAVRSTQSGAPRCQAPLKLFLSNDEIEELHDFEEDCVEDYSRDKQAREREATETLIKETCDRCESMYMRQEEIFQRQTMLRNIVHSEEYRLRIQDEHTDQLIQLVQGLSSDVKQLRSVVQSSAAHATPKPKPHGGLSARRKHMLVRSTRSVMESSQEEEESPAVHRKTPPRSNNSEDFPGPPEHLGAHLHPHAPYSRSRSLSGNPVGPDGTSTSRSARSPAIPTLRRSSASLGSFVRSSDFSEAATAAPHAPPLARRGSTAQHSVFHHSAAPVLLHREYSTICDNVDLSCVFTQRFGADSPQSSRSNSPPTVPYEMSSDNFDVGVSQTPSPKLLRSRTASVATSESVPEIPEPLPEPSPPAPCQEETAGPESELDTPVQKDPMLSLTVSAAAAANGAESDGAFTSAAPTPVMVRRSPDSLLRAAEAAERQELSSIVLVRLRQISTTEEMMDDEELRTAVEMFEGKSPQPHEEEPVEELTVPVPPPPGAGGIEIANLGGEPKDPSC